MNKIDEVLFELLQDDGCSKFYESECSDYSNMNVNISSCSEQSISSYDKDNVRMVPTFFLLQGLYQNADIKTYYSG